MQLSRGLLTVAGVALILALLISLFIMRSGDGRHPDNGRGPSRRHGRNCDYTNNATAPPQREQFRGGAYQRQVGRNNANQGHYKGSHFRQGAPLFNGGYQYHHPLQVDHMNNVVMQPMMVQFQNGSFGPPPPPNNAAFFGHPAAGQYQNVPPITLPIGFPGTPTPQMHPGPPGPPERVPLFVNPNLANLVAHQEQLWKNSDGYAEVHGQEGTIHYDSRKKDHSQLEYKGSTGSDAVSTSSSEGVSVGEKKEIPLPLSLNSFQFNGLNFPMIAQEYMNEKEKVDYKNLMDSITRQIKEFFRPRNKLWDNSDSRIRMVREDGYRFESEKEPKKEEVVYPPVVLDYLIPAKPIAIPRDSFVELSTSGTNEQKPSKAEKKENEKSNDICVFEKQINAEQLYKNLQKSPPASIPVNFSKDELAELHQLIQSGQETVVVMLAEFAPDRTLVGNEVGEPDRPEVPEDSADEADLPPTSFENSEDELPTVNSTGSPEEPRHFSRLSGFTDNNGTPNRGRSASNLGASSYARIYHAHVWHEYNQNDLPAPVYRHGHRRLPEIPREYLEAETAAQNSPVTPPPPPPAQATREEVRRVLPPTPYRRRHQSHDSAMRVRNGSLPQAWMNEHPYLRFLIPTEEAFMARVPFPPYRIPLIGVARREPGQPFIPQRILPAHENYDQFRSRMRGLWDNDEETNTRGTGALCLEPRNLCLPTSAERAALLRQYQDAEVEEAARRSGEPVIPGQKLQLPKHDDEAGSLQDSKDSEDPFNTTSSSPSPSSSNEVLLKEEEQSQKPKKKEKCNNIPPLHRYHRDSTDDDDEDEEGKPTCSGSISSNSSATIPASSSSSSSNSNSCTSSENSRKYKKEKAVKDTATKNQKKREQENRRAARKEEEKLRAQLIEEKKKIEKEKKEMKRKARQEELDRQKAIEDQRAQEEAEKLRIEKNRQSEVALQRKNEKNKLKNQLNKEKKRNAKQRQYEARQQQQAEEREMIQHCLDMKCYQDFDKSILEKLAVAKMALDADEKLHRAMKREGISDEVLESTLEPALLELADYEEIDKRSIRERSSIIDGFFKLSKSFQNDVKQQMKCAEEGRFQMTKGICLLRQTEASRMFILTRDLKYARAVRQYRTWYTQIYEELSLFINFIVGIPEVKEEDPTIEKFEEWAVYPKKDD